MTVVACATVCFTAYCCVDGEKRQSAAVCFMTQQHRRKLAQQHRQNNKQNRQNNNIQEAITHKPSNIINDYHDYKYK
jgi:hypothetical protein